MKELMVATANKGKLAELGLLLKDVVPAIRSFSDFPGLLPAIEDGSSFEENAQIKAAAAAAATGLPAIADDSGLIVDSLAGAPGVFSARYAGEDATDAENNNKLLKMLIDVPPLARTARFRCVIAFCEPGGICRTFDGDLRGIILADYRGTGGFGYDPLFLVREYGMTLAELPLEIKNRISHRGVALAKLIEYLLNCESDRTERHTKSLHGG